jgi:8-oxo-dGTP pyrophosphatase MutT (NUDIX family)
MPGRACFALLLLAARGCVVYEYEHEFWLRVDGSGTVHVTGRPELWTAFKGLGRAEAPEETATRAAARELFERSGLRVRRVTFTRRQGRPYLFVSADFTDLGRLPGTPAFPDLALSLRPEGERLRLDGAWSGPGACAGLRPPDRFGLMAVRFHLPSKVYEHRHAFAGVERGNIVGWRQEVARACEGGRLEAGALIDRRSILRATVGLFGAAIALGLALMALALYVAFRRGRRGRPAAG